MKKAGGGGGEMMLESRHLMGLFLGVVVVCGVFFTLGYVMGRTQGDSTVRAANIAGPVGAGIAAPLPTAKSAPMTPAASDWALPSATETRKSPERLQPTAPAGPKGGGGATTLTPAFEVAPPPRSAASASAVASKPAPKLPAKLRAPSVPRGAIVLQVAALSRESDALALAEALQHKSFPAYVLQPQGDTLYRVQVGPYADSESADSGKKALQREGFKAILKR
jgi:cell division septation protein DedD